MAEILRESGCVVYASSQPPIQKADIERLPPTEAEIEDARQEGYNEGYEEGKSEWRGVKAQLWNAMQQWLKLRHGLQEDGDDGGYTVDALLEGLAEVEAENKRLLLAARRVRPTSVAADRTLETVLRRLTDIQDHGDNPTVAACIAAVRDIQSQPLDEDARDGVPQFTFGHCENHKAPGGCQLHNLQCGYPDCDRRPAVHSQRKG